jgi:hypothetical protein
MRRDVRGEEGDGDRESQRKALKFKVVETVSTSLSSLRCGFRRLINSTERSTVAKTE